MTTLFGFHRGSLLSVTRFVSPSYHNINNDQPFREPTKLQSPKTKGPYKLPFGNFTSVERVPNLGHAHC